MAHHVCPWWLGYLLASPLRRMVQDPAGIVGPWVTEGMTVLEPGPGMGFFTLEMARRVGAHGRVVAVDVQEKMIAGLLRRARKAGLADRIDGRVTAANRLGVESYAGKVDFALAFAMVHEVPDAPALLADIHAALRAGGRLLIAEPTGHVRTDDFELTIQTAVSLGFTPEPAPTIRRSMTALLVKR